MARKIVNLLALIIVIALLWFANSKYPEDYLEKGFYTFLALAIIYFIFKVAVEGTVTKRIKEAKARYSFRKVVSVLYLVVLLLVVIRIWVEETGSLLLATGLIIAGIAIALQDFFKNFVGGILIFTTGIYRVGDRIEIASKVGDVIDIGIFNTTILELKGWVAGDQATGRLTIIPNGYVLSSAVNNYTKDHNFIWDEISLPLTYDSDWKEAITKILTIVKKETENITDQAEKEISNIREKYYLGERRVEPQIFLTPTDNWINLNIRYVVEVRGRRLLRDKLSRMILSEIEKSENIKIASATFDIVGFPEVKLTQK